MVAFSQPVQWLHVGRSSRGMHVRRNELRQPGYVDWLLDRHGHNDVKHAALKALITARLASPTFAQA